MKVRGFTLVELLTVIVILAIVSLIAIPMVVNIIEDTSISAAKTSVENYIKAVNSYVILSQSDMNLTAIKNGNTYNVNTTTTVDNVVYRSMNDLVDINGSKPTGISDYVTIDENGKVTDASITMSGYVVTVENGKIKSVSKSSKVKIESMTLNYTTQTMEKDSTFKLEPVFTPSNATNQEVTYKSSNESVVTVAADGTVTAVGTGTANITVTSKADNSKQRLAI